MRIDQDGRDAGAAEHRRSRRTGKPAADDRNVRPSHVRLFARGYHQRWTY